MNMLEKYAHRRREITDYWSKDESGAYLMPGFDVIMVNVVFSM